MPIPSTKVWKDTAETEEESLGQEDDSEDDQTILRSSEISFFLYAIS